MGGAATPGTASRPRPTRGLERGLIGEAMNKDQQKVVQYLSEAHASEQSFTRVLQSQIAMTPRGSYRTILETHRAETRRHADRIERRLSTLGQGGNVVTAVVGF